MSVTTEPAFYDLAMTQPDQPAMLPLEESPWLELYRQAATMIHPDHPVVDLGCGTGRFAELLRRNGHGSYVGVDFSAAAIGECERYVAERNADTGWAREFRLVDLRDWQPERRRPAATTYVCLETLEHLRNDLGLVRRVPPGHEFIFSVPNYDSEAHLRRFQDPSDAWARYGGLLLFQSWQMIGAGPTHLLHLYRTVRRGDSW